MKYFTLISFIFLLLSSCKNNTNTVAESEFDVICTYFKNTFDFQIDSNYDKLIVISDRGCPNCNKNFMKFCLSYLDNENSIILITANSSSMDLTDAIASKGNVFFDYELNTSELNTFSSSRIIYFKNNSIDTMVIIDAYDIESQFDYFYEREGYLTKKR
ncbi:MAG: hypothetical protein PHZ24_12360 [Bacteroidales bacterium]|nr:hypothetical protein [Bacteroidales bacterium]MDY0143602.1 hypothetical protein [Bacteroidales bacterium]